MIRHPWNSVHMSACIIGWKPIRTALFSAMLTINKKKLAFFKSEFSLPLGLHSNSTIEWKNGTFLLQMTSFSVQCVFTSTEPLWPVTVSATVGVSEKKSWKFLTRDLHDLIGFSGYGKYETIVQDHSNYLQTINGFPSKYPNDCLISINKVSL